MRGAEYAELKAFAAVVERASFARAADHLGLSASALSQTIRRLEQRLGVRLLNRNTRSVAPTSTGEQLYERIAPMMRAMDAAVADAVSSSGRVAGRLRINTPRFAAVRFIAPRLGRFHLQYPDIELELVIDEGLSDIVAGHFDAGIRIGERLEKDVIARPLMPDFEMLAVASPDYLSRHGVPNEPADLLDHQCINFRYPGSGEMYRWAFAKGGKNVEMGVTGPLISNDQEVILEGALQGLGIAYTFDNRIYQWIKEGRLIRLLKDWSPTLPGLFLYYPRARHPQSILKAFIDCMLDRDLDPR
ncbi:LysR family transcriptional regulator [Microbulbifer hainanensis]|uniref:LysR family transcriptional regulator n=1 Tax=Microbulbifer hainanensis TaxID=2735675 RepID=UPI001865FBCC|nr:LysR family transcriptional regulator [Microbulbifer hainanensis]